MLILNDQLEAVQANDLVSIANRGGDQAHPATGAAGRRPNFCIDREAAPVSYRVCTKAFHRRARMLGIESDCLLARDAHPSRQPKDIVHAARPTKRLIGKIALPASGMVNAECPHFRWFDDVRHRTTQDQAKLETAWLVCKRPTVVDRQRLGRRNAPNVAQDR